MTETKTKTQKTTRPLGARRRASFLGGWRLFMRLLVLMIFVGLLGLWANASQALAPSSAGDGAAAPAELIFRVMAQTAPPQSGAEGVTESGTAGGTEPGANEPREIAPAAPIPALALSTRVSTIITGHIVRTTVIQAFKNPTNDWVEGVYYFPLPGNAAVDRMVLKIGDRVIQSEIQEKQQAVKTYNRAAAAGKTAALLEQYRPNTFSTRVANVEPASLVTVEISFQTLAAQDGASFSHLMPQIITPRYTPAAVPLHAVNETPVPNTDIPAAVNGDLRAQTEFTILLRGGAQFSNLRSVTHLIETQPLDNGDVVITLTGGKLPADKDFRLDWSLAPGAAAKTLLFEEVQGDDRYLLGILLPPMASDSTTVRPRDVTFILDISGSMQGAGIDQGRQALIAALDLLRPEDRFQIIVFNDQFAQFFDHAVPASNENLEKAAYQIAGLSADRGTEMYPALAAALIAPHAPGFDRQIVFLTDGAVNNEDQMFKLVSDHLGDARLFTVGLGYAPNSWFMRKSAEFGRGINIQIDNIQLARAKLGALFGDMAAPTLRNIALNAGPGADIYPRRMPDLFGARPVIFVAKTPNAAAPITLTAQQADDKITNLSVDRQSAGTMAGIGKLWARQKVEGLMDAELRGMDSEMVRQGIIDVALTHQIMSPYTSFVAVDKTPARVRDDFLKKAKLRAAPAKLASWSKVNTLATATPMAQSALFGLIALLLAGFVFFFYRKGRAFK